MNKIKKILCLFLSIILVGGTMCVFSACDNKKSGVLSIGYYNGGYGTEWLDEIINNFTLETDIEVIYDDSTSILSTMEADLKNGSSYDIYISHGIPFEKYAASGYLANLDDLYSSNVTEGVTFEDRIIDSALAISKYDGQYYKIPYTQGVGGIVYNKTMFEANGWTIPNTYAELIALCTTIKESKVQSSDGDSYVAPFVWGGNGEEYMWDYIVNEWWAQLAGTDKINETIKYNSADVFNPDGNYAEFKKAYTLWYDLIVKDKTNSIKNVEGLNKISSQAAFKNGLAAMMPNAHWLYNEMSDMNIPFEMSFMDTPTATGAINDTDYNYLVGFGDSMIVSAKSANLEKAKQFLLYLGRTENSAIFTEKTKGSFFAFDYSNTVLNTGDMDSKAITFMQSVKRKLDENVNFSLYSTSQISYMTYNTVMTFPGNQYFYTSAYLNNSSLITGNVTPDAIFDYLYDYANKNWSTWKIVAGLS
jgi:N-acetylglucosamine transport system substrate-binding protein